VVRVPSVAEEDARRLHRERDRLICERVQDVNRIKGFARSKHLRLPSLRPQAMARLEQFAHGAGRRVIPAAHPGEGRLPERTNVVEAAKSYYGRRCGLPPRLQ